MPSLEDLSEAEQAKAMALYSFVQGNPDVAKTMRKLAREKNPTMPVPDTDTLEEKFNGEIEQLREQIKKRDEESLENLKTQRRSDAHDRIRAAGLDPEEVEKKMVEEHIGSYETAIKFVRQERELAPVTPESITPMHLPEGKDLWGNKNKFARDQAFEAINELRAKRVGFR
jgi:nucleosome binding factor SPN SPT16 subunit